jgi:excisionase family DNA binding protein
VTSEHANPVSRESPASPAVEASSPWLLASEAATYLRTSLKTIYREARAGRLRHARVGGRRELRFRKQWLDEFLDATATPLEVRR